MPMINMVLLVFRRCRTSIFPHVLFGMSISHAPRPERSSFQHAVSKVAEGELGPLMKGHVVGE